MSAAECRLAAPIVLTKTLKATNFNCANAISMFYVMYFFLYYRYLSAGLTSF